MKEISEILENYKEYETLLYDRFGKGFCSFLTTEQMAKIGFNLNDEIKDYKPKEWTKENILKQLKEDVEFGWNKACNERGISSSLMYEVVKSWCKVLENGLEDFDEYEPYGKPLFQSVANKYDWNLDDFLIHQHEDKGENDD